MKLVASIVTNAYIVELMSESRDISQKIYSKNGEKRKFISAHQRLVNEIERFISSNSTKIVVSSKEEYNNVYMYLVDPDIKKPIDENTGYNLLSGAYSKEQAQYLAKKFTMILGQTDYTDKVMKMITYMDDHENFVLWSTLHDL